MYNLLILDNFVLTRTTTRVNCRTQNLRVSAFMLTFWCCGCAMSVCCNDVPVVVLKDKSRRLLTKVVVSSLWKNMLLAIHADQLKWGEGQCNVCFGWRCVIVCPCDRARPVSILLSDSRTIYRRSWYYWNTGYDVKQYSHTHSSLV